MLQQPAETREYWKKSPAEQMLEVMSFERELGNYPLSLPDLFEHMFPDVIDRSGEFPKAPGALVLTVSYFVNQLVAEQKVSIRSQGDRDYLEFV